MDDERNRETLRAGAPSEARDAAGDPSNRFGRYVRVQRLGAGGMGEVWKAWDSELARWVALKFLKHADEEELARFQREARTAAGLNHPNLAAVYEVGEAQGRHYIAMQYVRGRTLGSLPRADRRLLIRLLRDAAAAVHAAHDQGVVHRDLKPENLMVEDGRVFVMDFGLAKSSSVDPALSATGVILGTPSFMSPEQAGGRVREIDRRSDVYSLGATLYDVLTGHPPLRSNDLPMLLRMIAEEEPRPPAVDRDLDTIVMKCLEKDPSRRYPTAAALADDLGRWLEGEPIAARPPSLGYRLRKRIAKRKALVALGALLLIACGVFIGVWVAQEAQARRWAREAEARAKAGEWEEAKRLFDQARTRVEIDAALYRLCEERIAERRTEAERRKRENDLLGPALEHVLRLPNAAAGWRRALEMLDEVARECPWSWAAFMRKADFHQKLGESDAAFSDYGIAVDLNPRLAEAWYRRGRILLHGRRDLDGALAAFERAREADPKHQYAVIAQAHIALLRKEYARALELCDSAERTGGIQTDVHFTRAMIYEAQGDRNRAIDHYTKAIDSEPMIAPPYVNRGAVYYEQGNYDAALKDYEKAIDLQPQFALAYNNRGLVRRRRDDTQGALKDFGQAIALDPRDGGTYGNRGSLLQGTGDHLGAVHDFTKAILLGHRSAEIHLNRGTSWYALREFDSALADYTESIRLRAHPLAYYNRALALAMKQDTRAAILDLDRALEIDPKYTDARALRGMCRKGLGDAPGAEADYTRALEDAPADWPLRKKVEKLRDDLRRGNR